MYLIVLKNGNKVRRGLSPRVWSVVVLGEGSASSRVDLPVVVALRGLSAELDPLGGVVRVVAPRMAPVVAQGDGALVGLLEAERDAAGPQVVRQHAYAHAVSDGDDVAHVGHVAVRELRDVDQPAQVPRIQSDERAERLDGPHHAAQLVARGQRRRRRPPRARGRTAVAAHGKRRGVGERSLGVRVRVHALDAL